MLMRSSLTLSRLTRDGGGVSDSLTVPTDSSLPTTLNSYREFGKLLFV